MNRFFTFILFTFLLSGCTFHRLNIQTQYLSHEDLASFHIGTPDPSLYHPNIGQRLLIEWTLPAYEFQNGDLNLYLKVRFRNHQEREVTIPVKSKRGNYLYEVINDDFFETGGIITYFAEIRRSEEILACWKHPLWKELIIFEK